jgi:catechol 2,3-dioxygenase-like lactoylglutathione lyase family enzyme
MTEDDTNPFGLRFHHLGLAVRRPPDAIRFLGLLGYEIGTPVFDPLQSVNLILCKHDGAMPDVEVIYPGETKSPVDSLVQARPDGIVYHVCYVTTNLSATLAAMEQNGVRALCVVRPTPAILFGGCPVSFYNIVGLGLCEIIEDQNHRTR